MTSKEPRSVTVEAKTVQDGIQKALAILGVSRRQVNVQILAEGNRGLFGMRGAKPVRVKVALKEGPAENP